MSTPVDAEASTVRSGGHTRSWAGSTFAGFGYPGYRALWLNTMFATLGVVMCITTLLVTMADLTGSNSGVGSVTFAFGVPMLVLGPFSGVLADRLSKRLILLACQVSIGATALILGSLLAGDLATETSVLAAACVTGACLSLLGPTQIAYMGGIVPAEGIGNATALIQACLNLTRVVGPFVVAAMVAVEGVGTAGSFFLVSSLFAIALVPLASMRPSLPGNHEGHSVLAQLRLGLAHVAERPRLRRLVITFVCVTLLGFSYFVVLPRFTDGVLGAGSSGYGIMVGTSSIGGLLATLLVAPLADSPRVATILRLSAGIFGLALIATGAAPTFVTALIAMIVVGAAASAFQALNNAAAFREADPAYLGRITALMSVAWSLTSLMGLPVGFLADAAGERWTLGGIGLTLCALAMALAVWDRVAPVRADEATRRAKPAGLRSPNAD